VNKNLPAVTSRQKRRNNIYYSDLLEDKCYADAECDESPSAGWQFVKYCMRG